MQKINSDLTTLLMWVVCTYFQMLWLLLVNIFAPVDEHGRRVRVSRPESLAHLQFRGVRQVHFPNGERDEEWNNWGHED